MRLLKLLSTLAIVVILLDGCATPSAPLAETPAPIPIPTPAPSPPRARRRPSLAACARATSVVPPSPPARVQSTAPPWESS